MHSPDSSQVVPPLPARGTRPWTRLTAALALAAAACGGNEPQTATSSGGSGGSGGSAPSTIGVVHGAPTPFAGELSRTSHAFDGYARAAGSRGGLTVVGTTLDAQATMPNGLVVLPLLGDDPALPATTGEVRALAPYRDGLLVAAENALLFAKGDALFLSAGHAELHPLGIRGLTSRIADEDNDGEPETFLVLLTDAGLHELTRDELRLWTIPGEGALPSAALAQRDRLHVAYGPRLLEIERESLEVTTVADELGAVHAMTCSSLACTPGSIVYVATEQGLIERGVDGHPLRFTLAAEGSPPTPVLALAADTAKLRAYALTGGTDAPKLLRLVVGSMPVELATLDTAELPLALAVDKTGDVWTFAGGKATRFGTGTPVGFVNDVAPILAAYCSSCHGKGTNGAPKIDLANYDAVTSLGDNLLERMKDGSMPPPGSPPVPKEQLQLFADWLATKAP